MNKFLYSFLTLVLWVAAWVGAMNMFRYRFTHQVPFFQAMFLEMGGAFLLLLGYELFLKKPKVNNNDNA